MAVSAGEITATLVLRDELSAKLKVATAEIEKAEKAIEKTSEKARDAIGLLDSASFEENDTAIQAHIEKTADAKKAPSGRPTLTAV